VDEEASQSYQNLIKLAYRERLIKIFEQPELKTALNETGNMDSRYLPSNPQASKADHGTSSQLRAVNAMDRDDCVFITSITRGSGGTGVVSDHVERAMVLAKTEAAENGADSYFIVSTDTTDAGATVVLDALNCN